MKVTNDQICQNEQVISWVMDVASQLSPSKIQWIDGSKNEYQSICDLLVEQGVFTKVNDKAYPNSYWSISDPTDVARVEERTFICSKHQQDAGPTNYWMPPIKAHRMLQALMHECMRGKTMYVIPYLMGPVNSPFSRFGIEITDSPYVVANMCIMARTGKAALDHYSKFGGGFVKGIHSVGHLDPDERYICHFPEDELIISFNSNYGGNALLGKKCFALRIASALGQREHWLAEHMLILGLENPKGEKIYIAAAFPSACGKTNLAMLIPPDSYIKKGWKVTTVGDDIAWINVGADGRWYAINPEAGFFGVAPGTSAKTNLNAMLTIEKGNTIFTNTALDTDKNIPWWEGLGDPPAHAKDWNGREWTPQSGRVAAHANSRFTTPAGQCPSMDPAWEDSKGVPLSAIIFGGRRARTAPLVYETRDWQHGTFVGATMASERTAAAAGKVGELRRDPMAMKPFIGYHVGDYFNHWLEMGQRGTPPKVYHVNWFRTDDNGKFLWPGFGENIRVLEWIFERVKGRANAKDSPLGYMPEASDINREGLNVSEEVLQEILTVRAEDWADEITSQEEFFREVGSKNPRALWDEHYRLKGKLGFL